MSYTPSARIGEICGLGAIAHIDTAALTHNLSRVRALAPRSRVLAVVKADAYGHGLLDVARALQAADGFAVARLSEATRLRADGISQRIVLLAGVHDAEELAMAAQLDIDVVVHHATQVEMLEQASLGLRVNAWLKVDSGMHRLGLPPAVVAEAHARLLRCPAVKEPLRVMTHLADADDPHKDVTNKQIEAVRECTSQLDVELSIGNSAGIMAWPGARSDWVRPGIMLYGVSPFANDSGIDHDLRPAMTLTSRVMAINEVVEGAHIGYGGTYAAPKAMSVGAIAAGYADGYPRHVPSGTSILVDRVPVPIAGRVSMDTVTVDLRAQQNAKVGSHAVLWGDGLPVEGVARAAGTIGYELLSRVGSRVPRIMQRHCWPNDG